MYWDPGILMIRMTGPDCGMSFQIPEALIDASKISHAVMSLLIPVFQDSDLAENHPCITGASPLDDSGRSPEPDDRQ